MTAASRLAAFALVLGVVTAAGAALGAAVGPIDVGGGHDAPTTTTPPPEPGRGPSPAHPAGADHGGGHR